MREIEGMRTQNHVAVMIYQNNRFTGTSYHIISYCIISYHIVSYHIVSYHIVSYHIVSYHIVSYHIVSYHIVSYHIVSIISSHIILSRIISSRIMSTQELNLGIVPARFYADNNKGHTYYISHLIATLSATDSYTTFADSIHRGDVRLNSSCPYYRLGCKVGGVWITPMVKYENLVHVNSQWEMGEDLWGANLVVTESNRCAGIPV